jgi:hypothetical protein
LVPFLFPLLTLAFLVLGRGTGTRKERMAG